MDTNKDNTKEFDIIGLFKIVIKDTKTLMIFLLSFTIMGVIVALNTPRKFTTNVILAPEFGSTSELSDNLSDLASMVGVDLSNKGGNIDAIYPQIYPDIFASTDFIIKLFDTPISTSNNKEKTYYAHLTQDIKIPFWNIPTIWLKKYFTKEQRITKNHQLNPFHLTTSENDIADLIRSNIACTIDKKTNVITISVTDLDPKVSALMADTLCNRLQNYITIYRTKKVRNNLIQTEKLYKDAKKRYEDIRGEYNKFSDANIDITLPSLKSKQEDLENEMQLRYNTFTQTSQQIQAAQVKLQEKTPVFSIIQNASIPVKPSGTPRSYIVIVYIFIGFIIDTFWVLFIKRLFYKKGENKQEKQ